MNQVYVENYLLETEQIAREISKEEIYKALHIITELKRTSGRLFIIGVGGSAANASHAVNDFRKISGIEAYAPTDNVSEFTARTNDDGWETTFSEWLKISKISNQDVILVLSVGGGNDNTSKNIVSALKLAHDRNVKIISIVSRNGGFAKQVSDACILIPVVAEERITAHAEGWQGIIWHILVNAM